jgi:hypothetical protein
VRSVQKLIHIIPPPPESGKEFAIHLLAYYLATCVNPKTNCAAVKSQEENIDPSKIKIGSCSFAGYSPFVCRYVMYRYYVPDIVLSVSFVA